MYKKGLFFLLFLTAISVGSITLSYAKCCRIRTHVKCCHIRPPNQWRLPIHPHIPAPNNWVVRVPPALKIRHLHWYDIFPVCWGNNVCSSSGSDGKIQIRVAGPNPTPAYMIGRYYCSDAQTGRRDEGSCDVLTRATTCDAAANAQVKYLRRSPDTCVQCGGGTIDRYKRWNGRADFIQAGMCANMRPSGY
jgi:hypothetical protein